MQRSLLVHRLGRDQAEEQQLQPTTADKPQRQSPRHGPYLRAHTIPSLKQRARHQARRCQNPVVMRNVDDSQLLSAARYAQLQSAARCTQLESAARCTHSTRAQRQYLPASLILDREDREATHEDVPGARARARRPANAHEAATGPLG